jgi:hypothetical protein
MLLTGSDESILTTASFLSAYTHIFCIFDDCKCLASSACKLFPPSSIKVLGIPLTRIVLTAFPLVLETVLSEK